MIVIPGVREISDQNDEVTIRLKFLESYKPKPAASDRETPLLKLVAGDPVAFASPYIIGALRGRARLF